MIKADRLTITTIAVFFILYAPKVNSAVSLQWIPILKTFKHLLRLICLRTQNPIFAMQKRKECISINVESEITPRIQEMGG
jgi:hypothetical protein